MGSHCATVLEWGRRIRGRKIRVAVVEDQPLFRQMLASSLATAPGVRVVSISAGVVGARADFGSIGGEVDVAVLDIRLGDGDGIALGRELRESNPALGIVLLSATDSLDALLELPREVSEGWSYLSKTSSMSLPALLRAIELSSQGKTVLDPELAGRRRPRKGSALAELSTRQFEVLRLLAEGYSNAGIAERLGLAARSVDNHIAAIYAALGLASGGDINPRVGATLRFIDESAPR